MRCGRRGGFLTTVAGWRLLQARLPCRPATQFSRLTNLQAALPPTAISPHSSELCVLLLQSSVVLVPSQQVPGVVCFMLQHAPWAGVKSFNAQITCRVFLDSTMINGCF